MLGEDERAELARLAQAQRRGEDVQYAAFAVLCPTGKEGAFDERMCDVYRTLHDAGLVEGESDGAAFYFSGLNDKGIAFAEEESRFDEGPKGLGESEDGGEHAESQRDAQPRVESDGRSGRDGILVIAAAAGFAAGLIGGVAGACVVHFVL